jgi:hypothetical protein
MSNRPRREYLKRIKEKLAEAGILRKRDILKTYKLRLSDQEAKEQMVCCAAVAIILSIILIFLPYF